MTSEVDNQSVKDFIIIQDERMKLPENHPYLVDDNKEDLTFNFMDTLQLHCFINLAFFYKSQYVTKEFTNNLRMSLQKLIEEEFPELTGSIQLTNEFLTLRYSNAGYRFIEAQSTASDTDMENLPFCFFATSKIERLPISESEPVFLCQVTHVPDGVVLAVSMYHCFCDMHGMVVFMKQWMKYFDHKPSMGNKIKKVLKDRDLIPRCKKGFMFPIQEQPGWIKKRLHVKKKTLASLKQEFLEEVKSDEITYLSSNDVLGAVFWKALMKANGIEGESDCLDIAECRARLGLSESYFPNCVFNFYIQKDINKLSSAQLAASIRREISGIDKGISKLVEQTQQVENVDHLRKMINILGNGMVLSSWSKFCLYDINFGLGIPTDVSSYSFGSVNAIIVMPDHPKKESFSVLILIKQENFEKLINHPDVQKILS